MRDKNQMNRLQQLETVGHALVWQQSRCAFRWSIIATSPHPAVLLIHPPCLSSEVVTCDLNTHSAVTPSLIFHVFGSEHVISFTVVPYDYLS